MEGRHVDGPRGGRRVVRRLRAEHGRGARLLRAVLDRAAGADRRRPGQLRGLIGDAGALAIEAMLKDARRPGQGLLAAEVGGIALLVGATSVFGELQDALDRIWRVQPRPGGSNVTALLRTRLLSFGMVL